MNHYVTGSSTPMIFLLPLRTQAERSFWPGWPGERCLSERFIRAGTLVHSERY